MDDKAKGKVATKRRQTMLNEWLASWKPCGRQLVFVQAIAT